MPTDLLLEVETFCLVMLAPVEKEIRIGLLGFLFHFVSKEEGENSHK